MPKQPGPGLIVVSKHTTTADPRPDHRAQRSVFEKLNATKDMPFKAIQLALTGVGDNRQYLLGVESKVSTLSGFG